ncbi:ABC transporter ATP-binding protein [Brucella anthropi]|uniref:ABC transporter ATP-binding protein n=1 Tax=Brucella anthropi TaxID=529 RepID=UPI000DED20F1|nr:ABC transporter ATP-binding protein [Brucella anthropi]RCI77213.1 ABC transporter ATP-binding protein [Brucella anthropi]
MSTPFLAVEDLTISFETAEGPVTAVDGISYQLQAGETLGVVGESGSGKSLHVLAMVGLLPKVPGLRVTGSVRFQGRELLGLPDSSLRDIRGREIGFVFQDPMTAMNPVLTIERQLIAPLIRHMGLSQAAARSRAIELLDLVGIPDPGKRIGLYPFQLSGGMRQRVMIAMGLSCDPKLLIADEATTALDVTVQAQVLDLVQDLKRRLGTTIVWITHDMGVVAGLAQTVQVMYCGRIMERGPVRSVFHDPRNAYTWGLMRSLPQGQSGKSDRLYQIPGQVPRPTEMPPGDPFAPRNEYATPRCHREMPPLVQVADGAPGHLAAAWYDLRQIREART